jgi:hypothetical protein
VAEATSAAAGLDEAKAFEDVASGRGGGPGQVRVLGLEISDELAWPPGRVLVAEFEQGLNQVWGGLVGTGVGGGGAVGETIQTFFGEAIEPLVASLATDTVVLAELGEVEEAALIVSEKVEPFFSGSCFFPRHDITSWRVL